MLQVTDTCRRSPSGIDPSDVDLGFDYLEPICERDMISRKFRQKATGRFIKCDWTTGDTFEFGTYGEWTVAMSQVSVP